MIVKNELKENLRIRSNILKKIMSPVIVLDPLSTSNHIQPNCN